MNTRRKFLTFCTAALIFLGFLFLAIPFVGSWNPNIRAKNNHFLYVDLDDVLEDQAISMEWAGYEVVIVRPRQSVLDQLPDLMEVKKYGEQHPSNRAHLHNEIKVFVLPKWDGMVRLSEHHYWRTIIPCKKFEYLPQGYHIGENDLEAALKCTDSHWTGWKNKLVFDLDGRSQDKHVANLWIPNYTVNKYSLVLGDH